jgi:hypothetical protein
MQRGLVGGRCETLCGHKFPQTPVFVTQSKNCVSKPIFGLDDFGGAPTRDLGFQCLKRVKRSHVFQDVSLLTGLDIYTHACIFCIVANLQKRIDNM